MAKHTISSRDTSNAGGSSTHTRISFSTLRHQFNHAAALILALIVAVAIGVTSIGAPIAEAAPSNPGEGEVKHGDEYEYLGCASFGNPTTVPARDPKTAVQLRIEGYQRNGDNDDYTKFIASNYNAPGTTVNLNDSNAKIENVANNQSMVVDINVEMTKPSTIEGVTMVDGHVPYDWIYPLPFNYADVNESSKSVVKDPSGSSTPHAWMQVVKGCGTDDKAYLRVNYNPDWIKPDPDKLGFAFAVDVQISADNQHTSGSEFWTFPGVDTTVTVEWSDPKVRGSKSCDKNANPNTCTITINPEKTVPNFKFYDKSAGMDIDFNSIKLDGNSIPFTQGDANSGYDFMFVLEQLASGQHTITYEFAKNDTAIWTPGHHEDDDNNKPWINEGFGDTFKNDAWWTWGDDKRDEAHWTPGGEWKPEGGGGEGEQDHRTNIFKNVENQTSGDIKWTIGVNSDKKHPLAGFKVTDTLSGRHDYDFANRPLVIRVKDDGGHWQDYATIGGADSKGTFEYVKDANTFSYTFPDDAEQREYQLEYYTVPQTNADGKPLDMSVGNGASVCDPDDCDATKGETSSSTTIRDTPETSVTKKNVQSDGWNPADGEIKQYGANHILVPWSLEFDPSEELAMHPNDPNWKITNLELKEDWVNANSDGNTLHMWYSTDTIDLKVFMKDSNGNWQTVPASAYRVYANLDGNKDLFNTGANFPADWYQANDKKNGDGTVDNYPLHQGVPRFKIRFDGGTQITGPVKITYNTIFDRTPDSYVNYAQFKFDAGGKSYDTPYVSSEYVHGHEYQAGKTTDPDHYGKDYWDNQARLVQCKTIEGVTGMGDDDECWTTEWTVWANGPKPWGQPETNSGNTDYWATGISGAVDMTDQKVTFTDELPAGWNIVSGSLKAILMLPNYVDGTISTHDIDAELTADSYDYSYDESANKFTVTIDNMSNVELGTCEIDSKTASCPTEVNLKHAVIKFVYTTYLPYKVAEQNGYKRGEMQTATNRAQIDVGDHGAGATGETVIYKPAKREGVLDKQLDRNTDSTKTNRLDYKIIINKDCNDYDHHYTGANLFPGNADTITLTDVLNPMGQYVPDSLRVKYIFSNGGGVSKPSVTYKDPQSNEEKTNNNTDKWKLVRENDTWDDNSASLPKGWTKTVTRDPETGSQQFELTIPKNLQVINTEDGPWNSATNSRDYLYGTLIFDEHIGIEITYQVSVNGLPGQTLEGFSNSAKLRADASYDDETSNAVVVPSINGSVWQSVTPTLRKVDSNTNEALDGAQFSLKRVDLHAFYNTDGTLRSDAEIEQAASTIAGRINDGHQVDFVDPKWDGPFTDDKGVRYLQSGSDGATNLPNLSAYTNTLFVLQELRAPNNYERSPKNFYLVATDTKATTKAAELIKIVDAINAQIRFAKNKIVPLYPDVNNDIFVGNDKITDMVWGKVNSESGTLDETTTPVHIKNPTYLRGSVWKISTENPTGENAKKVCSDTEEPSGGLLPCTVYVADNATESELKEGQWYVPDDNASDGMLMVKHLKPNHTYTLQEATPPDGYNLDAGTYTFSIDENGTVTWSGDNRPWEVVDSDDAPTGIRVIGNAPAMTVRLPETGGQTVNNLLLSGLSCVAAALLLGMWYMNAERRRPAHAISRRG